LITDGAQSGGVGQMAGKLRAWDLQVTKSLEYQTVGSAL
jgi:hypothetical protein